MTMQIVFILVIVVASESARYLPRAHSVSGPKLTQLSVLGPWVESCILLHCIGLISSNFIPIEFSPTIKLIILLKI